MPDVSALLSEGMKIKARMAADKARLAEINGELEALAVFPEGRSTAHVAAGGFRATIQRKTIVKWDQEKLGAAMQAIGADAFRKVFTYKFEPVGKKQLDAFLEFAPENESSLVKAAMTECHGSPQVKFECVMEDADGAD